MVFLFLKVFNLRIFYMIDMQRFKELRQQTSYAKDLGNKLISISYTFALKHHIICLSFQYFSTENGSISHSFYFKLSFVFQFSTKLLKTRCVRSKQKT